MKTRQANFEIYQNKDGKALYLALSRGALNDCMNKLEKNSLIGGVSYSVINRDEKNEYLASVPYWEESRMCDETYSFRVKA